MILPRDKLSDGPHQQSAAAIGLASTPCNINDFGCICAAVPFITALTTQVKQVCSMPEQQATLAFAQQVCAPFGVNINVPGVAAEENVPSTPATSAALAATAPTSTAETNTEGSPDSPDTANMATSAASAADSTDVSTAPVSSNDFSTSSDVAAAAAAPATSALETSDDDDVSSTSSPTSSSSSLLVFDTQSVVPTATIASSSLPTDASTTNAQMATSTASNYANSTANRTVAASSPIPYVGAAIRGKEVQGAAGLAMMAVVGIFCWL
ncbi:MAG: hypothetical protein Q9216_000041 [Gyalolechia sp. 2 TL-2023]